MKKLFRKVLFEGEEHPKVNMICDALHEGMRAEFRDYHNKHRKNVTLMNCVGTSYIDFSKNPVEVYSPYIPYGMAVTMDFEGRSNYQDYDEIIYMQPFPFALADMNYKLDADVLHDYCDKKYKVMFYRDINQHAGAGGLVGIDQALEEAPDKIRNKLGNTAVAKSIEFCVYKTPMDYIHILHGGCGSLSLSLFSCQRKFEDFRDKLAHFKGEWGDYAFILEDYNELVDETRINNFTKFNKVRGCLNIIEKYTSNYMNELNDSIMRFIEKVYQESVKDICFWNLDRDIENLKKEAEQYIKQELLNSDSRKEKCPDTEADYNDLIRVKCALDVNFVRKAKTVISNDLMNYIYDYLKRKEKLLSNFLQ